MSGFYAVLPRRMLLRGRPDSSGGGLASFIMAPGHNRNKPHGAANLTQSLHFRDRRILRLLPDWRETRRPRPHVGLPIGGAAPIAL